MPAGKQTEAAVVVTTFTEFKNALEGDEYNYIYLGASISTQGSLLRPSIRINTNKGDIVIDGIYNGSPPQSLRDGGYELTPARIVVESAPASGSITITFRNMIIEAKNSYGMPDVSDSNDLSGVTIVYEQVTLSGPRPIANPRGTVRIIDTQVTNNSVFLSGTSYLAEARAIELGGKTSLIQSNSSNPVFRFYEGSGITSLTVLDNADVTIESRQTLFGYTSTLLTESTNPYLLLNPGASLHLETDRTICQDKNHRFNYIRVEPEASLTIRQNGNYSGLLNPDRPSLFCDSTFTVATGGRVSFAGNHGGSQPLIQFGTEKAGLILENPASFVLYRNQGQVINFESTTQLLFIGQQINYWTQSAPADTAGSLTDSPLYSWRKADGSLAQVMGFADNSKVTVDGNVSPELESGSTSLDRLRLNEAGVFSVGNLPLALDPIADNVAVISGTTQPQALVRLRYELIPDIMLTASASGRILYYPDQPLPTGTIVSIAVNLPFLISHTRGVSVPGGELTIPDVTKQLDLVFDRVSDSPLLYGRADPAWSLEVFDSRVRGGDWELYASILEPLTGKTTGDPYPDALVYVDDGGTIRLLGDIPIAVFTGSGTGSAPRITNVSWPANRGILMQPSFLPILVGEEYTTNIHWQLDSLPESE